VSSRGEKRQTTIEVRKISPGESGVYEIGIPVTSGEEFPFVFNVRQKTPVTERWNELDNSYRTELMQGLTNDRLGLFDNDELGEDSPIPAVGSAAIVSIIPPMGEGLAVLAGSLNTVRTMVTRVIYETGFDENVHTESSANQCHECDGRVTTNAVETV
jgi:hypothetical protein